MNEQRTLPILITVGMLLGVGLAVASPAQREGRPSTRPTTIRSVVPEPSVAPSPDASPPERPEEDAIAVEVDCGAAPDPRVPDELGSGLPHAAHMLLVNCAKNGGKGLGRAIDRVTGNDERGHGSGRDGQHGRSSERHGSDRGGGGNGAPSGRSGDANANDRAGSVAPR